MSICTHDNPVWMEPSVVPVDVSKYSQKAGILVALGLTGDRMPKVDEDTLYRYYEYLSAKLSFPFAAHYPEPTNQLEQTEYRCVVLELLDPKKHLGDEFDGIFCKTRKGKYEINLPLIELFLPQSSRNSQLIEDYWFWFWNWK
jgi:hypothetical protein